jgi:endonuclease-3
MKSPGVRQILDILRKQYGARQLEPHYEPIAELVRTILSQNTSDINSRPTFMALVEAFDSWDKLLTAEISQIASIISRGGLGQIKAQRIQQALWGIKNKRGKIDLNFLIDLSVPEAQEWLKQLPGVGNKTANCVLLFALGKPALPVDTHIFRVSKRLALIDGKASLDDAHRLLGALVPADDVYEFHVLMIEHGRRICTAQKPRCPQCPLREICPSSQTYIQNQNTTRQSVRPDKGVQ